MTRHNTSPSLIIILPYKVQDSDFNSQMLPIVSSNVEKMVRVEATSDYSHSVDDIYLSAEEQFPITDEKLQEELLSSASSSRKRKQSKGLQMRQLFKTSKKEKGTGKGKSSNSQSDHGRSLCLICMDMKPIGEMFRSNTCTHLFCTDCILKYIATKLQEKISRIVCPELNCGGALEPQFCRSIVPREVFDRWENALCESLILASKKFYCPFRDCSAMLVDDGESVVVQSECPICHRLFCAQCKVPWHAEISCNQFQQNLKKNKRSKEDDMMVTALAKEKKWRRCPNCKFLCGKD